MAAGVVGGVTGLIVALVFLSASSSQSGRVVGATVLAGIAAFCGYGFLCSFEYPGINAWKISYALTGLASLFGTGWLLFARPAS